MPHISDKLCISTVYRLNYDRTLCWRTFQLICWRWYSSKKSQDAHYVQLWKRDSRTITTAKGSMPNRFFSPDIKYHELYRAILVCMEEDSVEQIPSDIPLACLDENVSIQKIKKYFDSDGWAAVQHVYEAVKSAPHWPCKLHQEDLYSMDFIVCSCCLDRLHFTCTGKRATPKTKTCLTKSRNWADTFCRSDDFSNCSYSCHGIFYSLWGAV